MTHTRRTMPFLTTSLGLALLATVPLSAARADDQPAADPAPAPPAAEAPTLTKVTVQFDKTKIEDATAKLHELSGYNFVVGTGVQGEVTASFTDQPIDKVLRTIGLALSLRVEQHDKTFVIRPVDPIAATIPAGDASGAGALLPGAAATKPLAEAGATLPPLAGTTPGADGARTQTRTEIPLGRIRPDQAAAALGGGFVDRNGVYHSPEELQALLRAGQAANRPGGMGGANGYGNQGGDPWANLPPDARVTNNGVILLPNGSTVLPNGTVIARDGTIVTPPPTIPNYSVPFGAGQGLPPGVYRPGQYPGQQPVGPVMQGNVGGLPFMIGPDGTTVLNPGAINVGGGLGQIYLPPMVLGGGGQQNGYPYNPYGNGYGNGYGNPYGQQGPTLYWNTLPPNVHYGKPPVAAPQGSYPPGWNLNPPPGMENLMFGTTKPIGTPIGTVVDPNLAK